MLVVTPSSKKCITEDVAKHISSKTKKPKKRKLILQGDEDKEINLSPQQHSPIKSTFEMIGIERSSVETSIADTSIIFGESTQVSAPMQTSVIPAEVSFTESFHEEVQTSGISTHVPDTDVNVYMAEVVSNNDHPVVTQEEGDIPDHMLMYGKQFKILNKKLNSILQSHADARGFETSCKGTPCSFVQDAKMICENVNHKLEELKVDVSKELHEMDNKYSSLLENVDIIVDVVTTFVKTHQSFDDKFDEKAIVDVTNFGKVTSLLEESKDICFETWFLINFYS
ncbi:unnamed protein product [Lactuca saligna]|uniref:Uncharacterized protein n=1 Tax=Lactuca saligna TaxID=75948 RepID=A0AA35VF88_LACSI|nr:unnamed protein product [Lactuca saligna]